MKLLKFILLGSLALTPVYEDIPGSKQLITKEEKVEATITVDRSNRVHGYVEGADKTKFFSEKKEVRGEWKSDGSIEVKDKHGYKYNLKPEGKRRIGERKTHSYKYRTRRTK